MFEYDRTNDVNSCKIFRGAIARVDNLEPLSHCNAYQLSDCAQGAPLYDDKGRSAEAVPMDMMMERGSCRRIAKRKLRSYTILVSIVRS